MAENKMSGNKTPHWIRRRYISNERPVDMLVCSACNTEFSFDHETGVSAEDWNFCPNCGAKMKDGVNDGRNKMAEVARLFGKELGEEFVVEYIGRKDIIDTARFTVDGFETKNAFGNWVEDPVMLMWLLKGKAVIVDER
jgi:DNA-directed RNA polymerase subunit RPC12/RpoP